MNTTTIIHQLDFPAKYNYYLKMRISQHNSYEISYYYHVEATVLFDNNDMFWEILSYLKDNGFKPQYTEEGQIVFIKLLEVHSK